jgi:hypothetical protein
MIHSSSTRVTVVNEGEIWGAKHTPGPWEYSIDQHETEYWFDRGHICVGPAIIGTEYSDLDATDIANACLIAAAPDLLEALADFISAIGIDTDKEGDGFFDPCLTIGDVRKARAAIVKATEG